jgi:hypothetical protein
MDGIRLLKMAPSRVCVMQPLNRHAGGDPSGVACAWAGLARQFWHTLAGIRVFLAFGAIYTKRCMALDNLVDSIVTVSINLPRNQTFGR